MKTTLSVFVIERIGVRCIGVCHNSVLTGPVGNVSVNQLTQVFGLEEGFRSRSAPVFFCRSRQGGVVEFSKVF